MLDDIRAKGWEREARVILTRFLDTDNPAGRLAAIVLVLLDDREEREQFCKKLDDARLSSRESHNE